MCPRVSTALSFRLGAGAVNRRFCSFNERAAVIRSPGGGRVTAVSFLCHGRMPFLLNHPLFSASFVVVRDGVEDSEGKMLHGYRVARHYGAEAGGR